MRLATPIAKVLKSVARGMAVAAILFSGPVLWAENEGDAALREGIAKGLKYLTTGGKEWMDGHNCASCHHAPLMIWTLEYAQQRGLQIDREVLAEMRSWSLDPKTKMRPEPVAKTEAWANKVLPVVAYFTLASDRAEPPLLPAELRSSFVRHFLEKQEADGSWLSYVAHPPLIDCGETSTMYVLLALLGKDSAAEPNDPEWPDQKRRALEFLASVKAGDELQPKLWRLLLRERLGETGPGLAGRKTEDERAVLSQQHDDGGWGQTPSLPSDAYATGQALYFLETAHCQIPPEARRKAVAFLLKTQKENGSWAMTSRPRTLPQPNAGAKNLDIIGYAGSAWATMGLISATVGR